jgi:hypothetical protein
MEEQRQTYCSHCQKQVHLVLTKASYGGHANLPDDRQLVCLDFGTACTGDVCPLSGLPALVMGVRLARSDEPKAEPWQTVHALCDGCETVTDMEVLDEGHAFCPVCKTTNALVMIHMDDGSYVAATRQGS